MRKIFLIPGLGADARIYSNIELPLDDEVTPVNWIEPELSDTLESYAQRVVRHYNITENSVVIGNSLGGMVAIEIAKRLALDKTILISSIRTINEAPGYFSFFRMFPLYQLIPAKVLTNLGGFIRPVFGGMHPKQLWLFKDMLSKSSPVFLKWAMNAVLKWQNTTVPSHVYLITGDKDRVFDHTLMKDPIIIKGGSHIMVFDKAKEVTIALNEILSEK